MTEYLTHYDLLINDDKHLGMHTSGERYRIDTGW